MIHDATKLIGWQAECRKYIRERFSEVTDYELLLLMSVMYEFKGECVKYMTESQIEFMAFLSYVEMGKEITRRIEEKQ